MQMIVEEKTFGLSMAIVEERACSVEDGGQHNAWKNPTDAQHMEYSRSTDTNEIHKAATNTTLAEKSLVPSNEVAELEIRSAIKH